MDKNVVLARKYGRAIYEIAAEQNSLEKTGEELHLIADTIMGNDELKQLLFHPLLAKDVKKDTLNKLFADKVQPVVLQFCYVVIDKDRFTDFLAMVDVYAALVTSALPLTKTQVEALKAKLSEITGKKIVMKQKVDSALIGGFTVQVGDRLIDGSVARQLQTLKHIMKQRD